MVIFRGGAMSRRLTFAAVLVVIAFAAAQLIRPSRANPPTDPARTIRAHMGTASGLVPILDRSCNECHSNATEWPWYAQIAPVSWVLARGIAEGRNIVNFSEWGGYSVDQQRDLLAASCESAAPAGCRGSIRGCAPMRGSPPRTSRRSVRQRASSTRSIEGHHEDHYSRQ